MIKGTRKQMIVLKTGESRYFDFVYFILREPTKKEGAHADILKEANRILTEADRARLPTKPPKKIRLFFLGFLCGTLSASLLVLLLLSCGLFF